MCPWHIEMFTQFVHPVSRVSSQTFFSLQICLHPQGCLGPCLSCLGLSILLGWIAFMEKGSFLDGWLLTFVPLVEHPISITASLDAPWWLFWQSPSLNEAQTKFIQVVHMDTWVMTEFIKSEYKQSHFSSLCCQKSGDQVPAKCWIFTHSLSGR